MAIDYSENPTTLAHALRLTRQDGDIFGFTEHDEPATISAVDYTEDQGLTASVIIKTAGSDVGTLEITTLNDGSLFDQQDIIGGIWNNAKFLIFRYNWRDLADGTDPLLAGTIGEIRILDAELKIELRDLRQPLQQEVGNIAQKDCPYRLGSTSIATGGFCMKDVSSAPFTQTATVTTAGQQTFTASGRTEVDDYFGDGELEWLTGNNVGQRLKIKTFSGGVFTLIRPMFGTVVNGDTARVVAGCRKRFEEDCITKFANGVNFGGLPHLRGPNSLAASPV